MTISLGWCKTRYETLSVTGWGFEGGPKNRATDETTLPSPLAGAGPKPTEGGAPDEFGVPTGPGGAGGTLATLGVAPTSGAPSTAPEAGAPDRPTLPAAIGGGATAAEDVTSM